MAQVSQGRAARGVKQTTRSNTRAILAELAERASALHRRSIESYIECGRVLLEAREVADHGQWGEFLHQAGIPERTAQRMTRLARAGIKPDTVSDLGGIRATLDAIATVEKWPVETRAWWEQNGGPDEALLAATAIDDARAFWRALCNATPKDSPEWAAIVQAAPDGPWSTSRWIDFTDALITAETEDQKRDAMTLAPWKKEAA